MASKVAGYIGKIEKNGDWVAIGSTAYGVCETLPSVAEKVVDMKGFELVTGATVFVKFVHENTAQNPTVNINETGAKGIISADNSPVSAWLDGAVLALTFDGNNWATSGDPSGSAIEEGISTVSGSLVTLTDATDAPAAGLTVAIEPVQAGSGDPSPSNVRAISGWDTCNVYSTGKNLLAISSAFDTGIQSAILRTYDNNVITLSGTVASTNSSLYSQEITDVVRGLDTVTISSALISGSFTGFAIRVNETRNGTVLNRWNFAETAKAFTPSDDCKYHIIMYTTNVGIGTSVNGSFSVQLELGSTATTYEPYNGQTVTINLGDTRYGGHLDVLKGELTVDRASVDLGTLNWSFNPDYHIGYVAFPGKKPGRTNFMASSYKAVDKHYNAMLNGEASGVLQNQPSNTSINIKDDRFSTVTDFKNGVSGQTIVYELATPQTIQLTPAEVRTILGECHVWADTGDVSLTYWKEAGEGIAEAVSNAAAVAKYDDGQTRAMITQSSETAMVATKDYSEGDLVIIGGQLLRATENIATTTELVIGEDGNVEVVDLETILKELSARIGALEE